MHMTKTHSPFRFLNGQRLLYGVLLIILLGVIVASFSPSLVSKVAKWLQTRTTNQPPSTTVMATSESTLIPLHSSPVFNDPLNSQNDPYQWDRGPQGVATCFFAQGAYHISALARSQGGGCNPKAPNITFTNFVYQIRMVINQGTSKELKTGIFFCGT